MPIIDQLQVIKTRMKTALDKSRRQNQTVRLVAVSKNVPVESIQQAVAAGITDFGENRVQEVLGKMPLLPSNIQWHFIGRIQSNKINKLEHGFSLIHSVDSFEVASKFSDRLTHRQDILLEVNTSEEDTKAGVPLNQVIATIEKIMTLPQIHLRGLMTIGPYLRHAESTRACFRNLHEILNQAKHVLDSRPEMQDLTELSMGMSHDYEVAIEEGATIIRVGTALFGMRPKI
jgi:pyridoxal phosphate enzyme (YggS family)